MLNETYMTLEDGTVIDDEYVDRVRKAFDKALRTGTAHVEPNPHYHEPLRAKFSDMPKYLQKELKPFILNI